MTIGFENKKSGFTLLELLIVIGIIAILATITLIVLNPAEVSKQTRDAKRISELKTVDQVLSFSISQNPDIYLGSSSVVYTSLPDNLDINCGSYSLPSLPVGWNYRCVGQSVLRSVDGTGWLPINFESLSSPPFSALPVDPINDADLGLYYTYVAGSWELNAGMESGKYSSGGSRDVVNADGGDSDFLLEVGSNLNLVPTEISNRLTVDVKVATSCKNLVYSPGSNNEFYNPWTISGSGTSQIIKIWYWQPDTSLAIGESIQMAIYGGSGAGAAMISGSLVTLSGTGAIGWISADLPSPISITLGQTYVFGIGPSSGGYNIARDLGSDCSSYSPTGQGSYYASTSGGLDSSVPASSYTDLYGSIIGITRTTN